MDTLTGCCDLCSRAIKSKDEVREIMVLGKVLTFCCKSCESSFLSKGLPEELSGYFSTYQLQEANPLFSWLQEAALQDASDPRPSNSRRVY